MRGALEALRRRPRLEAGGSDLVAAILRALGRDGRLRGGAAASEGDEGRERQASLETLLAIVEAVVDGDPAADATSVVAELEARPRTSGGLRTASTC